MSLCYFFSIEKQEPCEVQAAMSAVEKTLLIIMPDAMEHVAGITALVDSLGFYTIRVADLRFTAERARQYFYSTRFTSTQLEHLCSAPVRCIMLSKVGALSALQNVVGMMYDEPSDARDQAPQSLRALYGTDRARCGLRCSTSLEGAKREISCVFPSPPFHQRTTEDYLQEAILPGLSEAIAEISRKCPADPFDALERWLIRHRPSDETVYKSAVLPGHLLKADGSADLVEQPDDLSEARNFRKCDGPAPVYGMAQSSLDGVEQVAEYLLKTEGHTHVVFINVREEPVIFIEGSPYTIRNPASPNMNVQHFAAVEGFELRAIERRLANDVLATAIDNGGMLQGLDASGESTPLMFEPDTDVCALDDGHDKVRRKYPSVEFSRIPFPSSQVPEDGDIDELLNIIHRLPKGGCLVLECDTGVGRTTHMMTVACLAWSALNVPSIYSHAAETARHHPDPPCKYSAVNNLLVTIGRGWTFEKGSPLSSEPHRKGQDEIAEPITPTLSPEMQEIAQQNGATIRAVVNRCVACTKQLIDMATCVGDCLEAAKDLEVDNAVTRVQYRRPKQASTWMRLASCYLKRYCNLLLIAAYLRTNAPHLRTTFREWHRKHWSVEQSIRSIHF